MSNEVITHKHEWVRGLFSDLDRIAKDAATVADENQPLLGGEHYLTDRELSERLKISRRTLQDYRNNGILPYRQLGGKILYRESDIERRLVQGVKKLGGRAYKFVSPGNVGVPDRLVVLPGGVVLFVEVKAPDGRLSPNQRLQMRELTQMGAHVFVVWDAGDVDEFLQACRDRYMK